jgi:hypothetical protein
MSSQVLHPAHLADLQRSGLNAQTIRAAGVYSVSPGEIGKKLGGNDAGIMSMLAFPYPGSNGYERFRCFYEDGKTGPKYRQPKGAPNRLYLRPGVDLAGDDLLLLTEGEKKALSLQQAGFQVVGLGGIWGWCAGGEGYRNPGECRPIPDLDRVNWRRPVTSCLTPTAPLTAWCAWRPFVWPVSWPGGGPRCQSYSCPPVQTGRKSGLTTSSWPMARRSSWRCWHESLAL